MTGLRKAAWAAAAGIAVGGVAAVWWLDAERTGGDSHRDRQPVNAVGSEEAAGVPAASRAPRRPASSPVRAEAAENPASVQVSTPENGATDSVPPGAPIHPPRGHRETPAVVRDASVSSPQPGIRPDAPRVSAPPPPAGSAVPAVTGLPVVPGRVRAGRTPEAAPAARSPSLIRAALEAPAAAAMDPADGVPAPGDIRRYPAPPAGQEPVPLPVEVPAATLTQATLQAVPGTLEVGLVVALDPALEAPPNAMIVTQEVPPGWKLENADPAIESFDARTRTAKWLFMGADVRDRVVTAVLVREAETAVDAREAARSTLRYRLPNGSFHDAAPARRISIPAP